MRVFGAQAVGSYRTRARPFLPDLEAAAHDDDPKVREAAAEAIQKIRGRESPPTD
jgi:HEAT repeat protein